MPKRKEYKYLEPVGNKGVLFISDYYEDGTPIEPWVYINKNGKTQNFRRARFRCPICHKDFISKINQVNSGNKVYCSSECSGKATTLRQNEHFEIGDYVDKNKLFIYLGEAGKNSSNRRKIKVLKQETNEIFEATVNNIKAGNTTRGPKELKEFRQQLVKSPKLQQARINSNTLYHVGDILGPDNNILFQKEIERTNPEHRRGKFLNLWNNIEFEANLSNVIRGDATGNKISKGELKLYKILSDWCDDLEIQKSFNDLKNPQTNCLLYFDAYSYNLNCVFEYDGEQHFKAIDNWGGEEGLKQRQYLDNLKNEYCKQHNIKIIRIPYTDYNILSIDYLKEKINDN